MKWLLVVSTLVALAAAADETADTADAQLPNFKANTTGPIGVLRTSSGAPVQQKFTSRSLNTKLLRNEYFIDSITHLTSERIPERFVHAKGSGAFGYFKVTHNVTDLTKAKFLDTIGKETRIAMRFSTTLRNKGESDLLYNIYGYSVKWYTEDGNFDIPGFSTPIFNTRDPLDFFSLIHAFKPNPTTAVQNGNSMLDFLVGKPEALFAILIGFSAAGLPATFRNVPGHTIHTMQLANAQNETIFSRFYFTPDLGIENMTLGITTDPDYYRRDLYNAISAGNYPSWTMWLQPLTMETVINATNNGIDLFDITRIIPSDQYPRREVGKLVLNENPKNYFEDIESLAFCPGNLVPGIVGGVDQLFEARAFAYRQAQIHRLGVNFNKIHVNKPIGVGEVYTYNRDGKQPTDGNEGGNPNYYPNSFYSPVPVADYEPDMYTYTEIKTSNLDQAGEWFDALSEADKMVIASNMGLTFTVASEELREKAVALFTQVSQGLADRVLAAYAALTGN